MVFFLTFLKIVTTMICKYEVLKEVGLTHLGGTYDMCKLLNKLLYYNNVVKLIWDDQNKFGNKFYKVLNIHIYIDYSLEK